MSDHDAEREDRRTRIMAGINAHADRVAGVAAQAEWLCEDGWVVIYTTSRVRGGPHDGKFLTQAFRPVGPGARGGRDKAKEWEQSYRRAFSTRRAAKARAESLYGQHSPKWLARNTPSTDPEGS